MDEDSPPSSSSVRQRSIKGPPQEIDVSPDTSTDKHEEPFSPYAGHARRYRHTVVEKLDNSSSEMLVLEFSHTGDYVSKIMKRSDLIQLVEDSYPDKLDVDKILQNKRGIRLLQLRDLRNIDPSLNIGESSLLVRYHCVLIHLGGLSVILLHDKCLLFIPQGADSVLSVFMSRLRLPDDADRKLPFEVRALEAVFMTMCTMCESEFMSLEQSARAFLSIISKNLNRKLVDRLRRCKIDIVRVQQDVKSMKKLLADLVEDEGDTFGLLLTYQHANLNSLLDVDLRLQEQDDLELLIESYILRLETVLTRIRLFQQEIANTENLITLLLDSARNRLLRFEILVNIITMALTVGSVVTGMFGMNLNSNVQEEDSWFASVCISITIFVVLCSCALWLYVRRIAV
eukprot:GILK01007849.1.p1 GENE.GILK01007849.1~~GILK01007849.1.p1  ORF type:complete len:421 (-),score=83.99 GILK01007849.1:106-1305(-)